MKRQIVFIFLCLLLASCSQEQKAYKSAVSSNDLAVLRSYIHEFDEKIPKKHLENASRRLEELVIDSSFFTKFIQAEDSIKKYNVCRQYQEQSVVGPHSVELEAFEKDQREYYSMMDHQRFEEVDSMDPGFKSYVMYLKYVEDFPFGKNVENAQDFIEHNKQIHQQMTEVINKMKKAFENYTFDGFDISGPDEYGEGKIKKTTTEEFKVDYLFFYRIAEVTHTFTGTYYVDDDFLMHADITEVVTYCPRKGSDYGVDGNKELMSELKEYFPSPVEHRCVCDLTSWGGGSYTLSIQESGKETEYYDGVLK